MGPWGGSAGGLRAPGRRCCTFARAPRRQKPRNLAEKRFRWRPLSRSHVRRPPSTHMGARQLHMTTDGKTHDPAGNRPPSRKGPYSPMCNIEERSEKITSTAPRSPPDTAPAGALGRSQGQCRTGPACDPDGPVPDVLSARHGVRRHLPVPTPRTPQPAHRPPGTASGVLTHHDPHRRSVRLRAGRGTDRFTHSCRSRWRRSPPPGRGCRRCRLRWPPRAAAGSGPARRRPAAGRPRRWRRRPPRD